MIIGVSRRFQIPFDVKDGTLIVTGEKNITLIIFQYVTFDRKFTLRTHEGELVKVPKKEGYKMLDMKDGFELSPFINTRIEEIKERDDIEYQRQQAIKREEKAKAKALKKAQKN